MRDLSKTFIEASKYLYPYISPKGKNIYRSMVFFISTIIVPIIRIVTPFIFLRNANNDSNNDEETESALNLTFAGITSALYGIQYSGYTMVINSVIQEIRRDNINNLLSDEAKFLKYGSNKDIPSLQYVTVGQGINSFTLNSIFALTILPTSIISLITTAISTAVITDSIIILAMVAAFTAATFFSTYLCIKVHFDTKARNQQIENELVGKINFVEENKDSISLINLSDKELKYISKRLLEVDSNILPLYSTFGIYWAIIHMGYIFSNNFFDYTFSSNYIGNISSFEKKTLNVMLMSLFADTLNIVDAIAQYYPFIKLDLNQLILFKTTYENCLSRRIAHNHIKQVFVEDGKFAVKNLSIKLLEDDGTTRTIFHDVSFSLSIKPKQIWKLEAASGRGKTTFLNAITNNGLFTEGTVEFPISSKDKICYTPQQSFFPSTGSLLDIIAYYTDLSKEEVTFPQIITKEEESQPLLLNAHNYNNPVQNITNKVKYFLRKVNLMPKVVKPHELTQENIDWSQRLSGGEKQKIAIIRALLSPKFEFYIFDEATSALDPVNKIKIYQFIKEELEESHDKYIVLYTEHGNSLLTEFANGILRITGSGIECNEF